MENSERYLNALIQRVITGRTPKELRLNGFKRTEYEREMGEMYEELLMEVIEFESEDIITQSGGHDFPGEDDDL